MKILNSGRDVRDLNRKMLKMNQFGDFQDPIELLENLFPEYVR